MASSSISFLLCEMQGAGFLHESVTVIQPKVQGHSRKQMFHSHQSPLLTTTCDPQTGKYGQILPFRKNGNHWSIILCLDDLDLGYQWQPL